MQFSALLALATAVLAIPAQQAAPGANGQGIQLPDGVSEQDVIDALPSDVLASLPSGVSVHDIISGNVDPNQLAGAEDSAGAAPAGALDAAAEAPSAAPAAAAAPAKDLAAPQAPAQSQAPTQPQQQASEQPQTPPQQASQQQQQAPKAPAQQQDTPSASTVAPAAKILGPVGAAQPTADDSPYNFSGVLGDLAQNPVVGALVGGAEKALSESGLSLDDLVQKASALFQKYAAQYQPLIDEYLKQHPVNITAGLLPAFPDLTNLGGQGGQGAAAAQGDAAAPAASASA